MILPKIKRPAALDKKHAYLAICILALFVVISDIAVITVTLIDANRHQTFITKLGDTGSSSHKSPKAASSKTSSEQENPLAVEQPPASQLANYQAPATHPKYLVIPKLGINTRVMRVGLTEGGAIDAPKNGYDAAWYENSSLPGTGGGATFIDGHVDGYYQPGVFYYLKKLLPGDHISVIKGDNTKVTYVVKELKTYNAGSVDMNQALSSIDPREPGLNLMTCTGKLVDNNTNFTERLVVFSAVANE